MEAASEEGEMGAESTGAWWDLLVTHKEAVLAGWLREQTSAGTARPDLLGDDDVGRQSDEFISLLVSAARSGSADLAEAQWVPMLEFLADLSRSRATLGFSPSETATFVFSLKQPLLALLQTEMEGDPALIGEIWAANVLLDKLGLRTLEAHQARREEIISRQQIEMLELSTPVVSLWQGILALPLIGTLDSARTQIVMESLLQSVVDTGSSIAIIDITGVPAVDTLVAQHLLKTVAAARLMGATCIVSGIRPQIAQTMVHLGVGFEGIVTKASMADALAHAFRLLDLGVTPSPARS
jgi:rsbT co-antagonist protein RsbR